MIEVIRRKMFYRYEVIARAQDWLEITMHLPRGELRGEFERLIRRSNTPNDWMKTWISQKQYEVLKEKGFITNEESIGVPGGS